MLRLLCLPLAPAATAFAVASLSSIRESSPAGSIHHPAAILAMLGFVVAAWAVIAFLHAGQRAAGGRRGGGAGSAVPDRAYAGQDHRAPRPPRSRRRHA